MRLFFLALSLVLTAAQFRSAAEESRVPRDFHFFNVVAPIFPARGEFIPVTAPPFIEHVRRKATVRGDYADATGIKRCWQ
ncbi:MAG TPA: hypothetical protein ENN29_01315, partial [Candidatus Hydrogenedentes bacterium]|nr:hypothetical protein [Candidatus Hydrogenedentota bacterium]